MHETPRLLLRRPCIEDASIFYELDSDPEVYRYLPPGRPFDRKTVIKRLQQNLDEEKKWAPFGIWVAQEKQSREFVAWALLMPTESDRYRLGYVVRKKFWGQGYATELGTAVVAIGSDNGLTKIEAVTSPENTNSWKVLEKLGFVFKRVIPGETPEIQLNLYQWKKPEQN